MPEEYDLPVTLEEIRSLEGKDALSLLEKKRLHDLYLREARYIKSESERSQDLVLRTERLKGDVEKIQLETETLMLELLGAREPGEQGKEIFKTAGLKRQYQDILKLWSREENEQALGQITAVLASDKGYSSAEQGKFLNLRFRIEYDIGNEESARVSYHALREHEKCSLETAQAGFLYSLTLYGKGDLAGAWKIFDGQCDPDKSLSNRIRRAYWTYRYLEKDPERGPKALEVLESLPPGLYLYLARAMKGEGTNFPVVQKVVPSYLAQELKVSSSIHEAWEEAERRLEANLRKDANVYLQKAARQLKKDPEKNLYPLLYTASLFRAAGNHLESMKIFSDLNSVEDWEPAEREIVQQEFLRDFARPFSAQIEWLGKQWQVDPDFVYSIMRQESAFNPGAISSADARGLMQLMPELAKFLSKQWGYRPFASDKFLFRGEENLKLAVFHLHQLKTVAPHPALMAAAYNAGINRTGNWLRKFGDKPLDVFMEMIPVNETRNYVKLVLRNYLYYKAQKSGGKVDPGAFSLTLPPITSIRSPGSIVVSKKRS
jgi:soluble lytic murein transglycosylase-like protein